MKKIGLGILAFLIGELVAISHKDKQFKKTLQKKEGLDKWKYIFQSLFNFNKELMQQAPTPAEMKKRAQEEYATLHDKVEVLEKNVHEWSEEKVKPHLEEIQVHFDELRARAKEYSEEIDLSDKLATVKQKVEAVKKKLKV